MWKPIGYISTIGLLIVSIVALGISAWFYDSANLNRIYENTDALKPYIDAVRAIIACDLTMAVVCFLGVFFLIKPSFSSAKFYCFIVVVVIFFKIIVGVIWYTGVDDSGKAYNSTLQIGWDICASSDRCNPGDYLNSWHTQRGMELASIIIFVILGLLSACGVLKASIPM